MLKTEGFHMQVISLVEQEGIENIFSTGPIFNQLYSDQVLVGVASGKSYII